MTTWYLAGPMRGVPLGNEPAFREAAIDLRELGYTIISPVELDSPAALADNSLGVELETYGGEKPGKILGRDVELVHDNVDGIIFLPGWERSRGARLEAFVGLISRKTFLQYVQRKVLRVLSSDNVRATLRENMP